MKLVNMSASAFLLLSSVLLWSPASVASNDFFEWQHVTPEDYPTVEQFFLKSDCSFFFTVAYLYDTKQEHWLSYSEAVQRYPAAEKVFASRDCEPNIGKDKIAQTFNLELPDEPGLILIYIGPHEGVFDELFTPGSEFRERFDSQQPLLDKLAHLPRYWVTTPLTGMRSQFQ